MIGKLVRLILGALIVGCLVTTAYSWTLSNTVLDGSAFDRILSASEVTAAGVDAVGAFVPAVDTLTLHRAITPGLIRSQIDAVVPALVAALTDGGKLTIDLRDIGQSILAGSHLNAAQLPGLFTDSQIVDFGQGGRDLERLIGLLSQAKTTAPLAALILSVFLALVAHHHRFKTLSRTYLSAAISTAIVAGLVWLPAWLSNVIFSNGTVQKTLAPFIHAAAIAVARAQSLWLLKFAGAYLAIAVLCFIIHPFVSHGHDKKKH